MSQEKEKQYHKLENGIPAPKAGSPSKYSYLTQGKPGQSVLFKNFKEWGSAYHYCSRHGIKLITRKLETGEYRIWITENKNLKK